MTRVLVVDNYDSFVFNLVQYVEQLGVEAVVRRNDEVTVDEVTSAGNGELGDVDGVLLSPGPGTPQAAGVSVELVRHCGRTLLPLLGVCLGHQAIAVAFGATVERAPELLHGKTSEVRHDGTGVLGELPDPFTATRYHSLAAVEPSLPAELIVNARTSTGLVMGIRHESLPVHGVQFHPESVLTQGGHQLIASWLRMCGADHAAELAPALGADVDALRLTAFR